MLDLNNVWLGRRDGWLGPMAPALSATVFNLASEAAAPALCCTPWRPGHLPGRRVLPTVVSVAAAGVDHGTVPCRAGRAMGARLLRW